MKKTKLFFTIILITCSTLGYAQDLTVDIQNMTYSTGGSINNCGTIDFEDNSTITIQFDVKLEKPYEMVVGNGYLRIFTKKSPNDYEVQRAQQDILDISWSGNQPNETYIAPFSITLASSEFNVNGGYLYAQYESSSGLTYNSACNYSIEKDEVPSFSLSPSNTTVSCGSTSIKTFTVTPSNIPNGATVSYQWSIGNGWYYQGNAVSNFTTTTNTIDLTPYLYPPSDVSVTPILNGESYPTQTSNVSLGSFNTIAEIIGDNYVCDSGIYTIANLPSNVSIQTVSSSNTNIATASLNANGDIVVTKVSDGLVTISATLQNSCSQTITINKENIQVGIPDSVNNAIITGNSSICDTQFYTYTLSGANHPCIGSIVWSVSPNLNIVSQNSTSVTVTRNPFNTQYAGLITANIPGSTIEINKGVWIGVPNTDGLTIQKIGVYDLYAGRWSKLKANYIPIQYEANDPLNITFEWQIPNSQVRNYEDTAYKDVKPLSSGQLNIGVRVVCDCGYGDWQYRLFDVGGDNNDPIELIPAD